MNIPIVNDRRLEDNELIRLVAIRPELLPDGYTPCSADVIIIDDDGQLYIVVAWPAKLYVRTKLAVFSNSYLIIITKFIL